MSATSVHCAVRGQRMGQIEHDKVKDATQKAKFSEVCRKVSYTSSILEICETQQGYIESKYA